jgi:hypothetical protein
MIGRAAADTLVNAVVVSGWLHIPELRGFSIRNVFEE